MTDDVSDPGFDPLDGQPVPYRRAPGARLSPGRTNPEGNEYLLKTPTGQLLVFGEQERFLWEMLDGTRSFAEIEGALHARFGIALAGSAFSNFLAGLLEAGAVERVPEAVRPATRETPAPREPGIRKIELVSDTEATEASQAATARAPMADDSGPAPRRGRGGFRRMAGDSFGLRSGIRGLWSRKAGRPERFFAALAAVFWPIRYIFWLVPLLLFAALLTYIKHADQYAADWERLIVDIPTWPCAWLGEHVTTWTGRIVEGTVITGYGGKIKEWHLKLFLGIFIRIQLDESSMKTMTRRQKLWVVGSPLISRLSYFGGSMLVWAALRENHYVLSQIALYLAFIAFITFVISSCPLIPLYGYKFLVTLLGQENLYGRAYMVLKLRLSGRPLPVGLTIAERWGLVFMGVGTLLVFSIYLIHLLYRADAWFINALNGVGAWIALAVLVLFFGYFVALWRFSTRLRASHRADRVRDWAPEIPAAL